MERRGMTTLQSIHPPFLFQTDSPLAQIVSLRQTIVSDAQHKIPATFASEIGRSIVDGAEENSSAL